MADYAKVNFNDIEDAVAGRVEGLSGHFGRKHLGSRDLGVSLWRYAPGYKPARGHRHREQEEAYVVVSGSGSALLDGDVVELAQWDVLRVAPSVVRAFSAGPDGLELVAVGGPKPEGGDGEQAEVSWPE